jgi:hypothetical protein
LSYGDFVDEEEMDSHAERTLFLLGSIMLPLVLLNLLIAIMGAIYAQVEET